MTTPTGPDDERGQEMCTCSADGRYATWHYGHCELYTRPNRPAPQQPPAQEREHTHRGHLCDGWGCDGGNQPAPPSEADSAGEDRAAQIIGDVLLASTQSAWEDLVIPPRVWGREAARQLAAAGLLATSSGARGADARPWVLADGDSRCQECGRPNPLWTADNALWNRVLTGDPAVPKDGVILCPTCFAAKADPVTRLGVRVIESEHPDVQGGDDQARERLADVLAENVSVRWGLAVGLDRFWAEVADITVKTLRAAGGEQP